MSRIKLQQILNYVFMPIKTVSGKIRLKKNCVERNGRFYEKGVDIQKINNRYRIMDIDNIPTKQQTEKPTIEVVVGFNSDGTPIFGRIPAQAHIDYFPVMISEFGSLRCENEKILLDAGYTECYADGQFYKGLSRPRKPLPWREVSYIKRSCDDKLGYEDRLNYGVYSPTNIINEGKKYWMGLEIETSGGFVPDRVLHKFNVKTMRDGSVRDADGQKYTGAEYVTGVLFGDHGFMHLQNLMKELSKRCFINKTCSIHAHFSGITFNKDFTVLTYILGQKIQDEIFTMLPKSRLEKNEYTNRIYCQKLPIRNFSLLQKSYKEDYNEYRKLMEDMYNEIFYVVSQGRYPSSGMNKEDSMHPGGRWCDPRYFWINFVAFNFKRENVSEFTCEFRAMQATLNFEKVKAWILLCEAFLYYVENSQAEIITKEKITIADILNTAYPKTADSLIEWVESRKKWFAELKDEKAEYTKYDVDKTELKSIKDLCVL